MCFGKIQISIYNTLLVPLPRGVGADTFDWINFLSAQEWGRTICGRVRCIAVCWLKAPYDRPGFHVMLDNGEERFIDVPPSGRPTLNMVAGDIGDIVLVE